MGESNDPRAVESLVETLRDDDCSVHAAAAKGLARIGKAAVGPRVTALADKDSSTQTKPLLIEGRLFKSY